MSDLPRMNARQHRAMLMTVETLSELYDCIKSPTAADAYAVDEGTDALTYLLKTYGHPLGKVPEDAV